ncbi:50S ribosomal protein L19e [Candidatus Tiddalikarchaeum anstoanum]|nr:50S ribosomal protein L19e [Candidatus Tiddalikarchaeum anstoanum]
MSMKNQKMLIARMLKGVGRRRIKINPEKKDVIKDAITRADLRSVIGTTILIKKKTGISRGRAKIRKEQTRKGRRKGPGSKKGAKYSRISRKRLWINKVRVQREFLKNMKLKNKIKKEDYRKFYRMIGGGFFRSVAHLKLYISSKVGK